MSEWSSTRFINIHSVWSECGTRRIADLFNIHQFAVSTSGKRLISAMDNLRSHIKSPMNKQFSWFRLKGNWFFDYISRPTALRAAFLLSPNLFLINLPYAAASRYRISRLLLRRLCRWLHSLSFCLCFRFIIQIGNAANTLIGRKQLNVIYESLSSTFLFISSYRGVDVRCHWFMMYGFYLRALRIK